MKRRGTPTSANWVFGMTWNKGWSSDHHPGRGDRGISQRVYPTGFPRGFLRWSRRRYSGLTLQLRAEVPEAPELVVLVTQSTRHYKPISTRNWLTVDTTNSIIPYYQLYYQQYQQLQQLQRQQQIYSALQQQNNGRLEAPSAKSGLSLDINHSAEGSYNHPLMLLKLKIKMLKF